MPNAQRLTPSTRVVFAAPGQVRLERQELDAPGPGMALLETRRTLISTGTELTALTGDFPSGSVWARYIQYPTGAGYSSVAVVREVGEGVEKVRVGDRVGSFAPHATLALRGVDSLWPVPDGVEDDAAAFATLAEIVMGGIRRSRLMFGEAVAIVGAGLLGQLAAHFCSRAGAWPVLVIDTASERLRTARAMGATNTIEANAADAREEVERLTGGRMADVVFEITGNPLAFPGAVRLARRLGRVVLLGSPRGPVTLDLHDEVHSLSLEIIGAHNSAHPAAETPNTPWPIARHTQLFFEWQAAGVLDVRPLITHRYSWRQTAEAYAMLLEDRTRALGVILDWTAE